MSYWQRRINLARKRGHFTKWDRTKAADWVTCACGKQDPEIPRDAYMVPVDPALRALGLRFYDSVIGYSFDAAEETLKAIDARAAEVLAEVAQ